MDRLCEKTRDRLVDYMDGELPENESRAVAEHLSACTQCREIMRGLERSLHLTRAIWLDNLEGSEAKPAGIATWPVRAKAAASAPPCRSLAAARCDRRKYPDRNWRCTHPEFPLEIAGAGTHVRRDRTASLTRSRCRPTANRDTDPRHVRRNRINRSATVSLHPEQLRRYARSGETQNR